MSWYSGPKRGVRSIYMIDVYNNKGILVCSNIEQYTNKREAYMHAKQYYIPGKRYAMVKVFPINKKEKKYA
ncbi:MAG: hypothetical protein ACI4UK_01225 [Floccifex sp.]